MTDAEVLSYVHSLFCLSMTAPETVDCSDFAPRLPLRPPPPPPSEWPFNVVKPLYSRYPIDKLMTVLNKISFNEVLSQDLARRYHEVMSGTLYKIADPQQRRKHELVLLLKYHGDYLLGIDAVDRWKADMIKEWVMLRQKLGPIFPLHATIVLRRIGHRFQLPLELQREIFSYLNTDHISEFCEEPYWDLMTVPEKLSVENQSAISKVLQRLVQERFSS